MEAFATFFCVGWFISNSRSVFCLLWLKYPSVWVYSGSPDPGHHSVCVFKVPLNVPVSDLSRSPLCKTVLCYFHYQQLFLNNSRVTEPKEPNWARFLHRILSILFFSVIERNPGFMVYHRATPPQEKSSYFSTETLTMCPVFSPIWKLFVQLAERL